MLEKAGKIIAKAFASKTDKAGKAYIHHLQRVHSTVKEQKADEELQCIALLHDLLEDCPEWNESRLLKLFPQRVVDGVIALTKTEHEGYSDYLDRLTKNEDAVLVKMADLQDNMDLTRLKL